MAKPSLFRHGPLVGEVQPVSVFGMTRRRGPSLVRKPVFGGLQPTEKTGENDDLITLSLRLFPEMWGGVDMLEAYAPVVNAGLALPLVQGGRKNLGFFKCENFEQTDSEIGVYGTGRIIEVTLDFVRAEPDRSPGGIAQVFGLF